MFSFYDVWRWAGLEALLLLMTICSHLKLSWAVIYNTTYPPYKVIPLGGDHHTQHASRSRTQFIPFMSDNLQAGQYLLPVNSLEIKWLNSTTDSIAVSWKLSENYNKTGFIWESKVEYFPVGGRFTSHPLDHNVREYIVTNLDAATVYTICAYMIEVYGENNSSSITHSKCVKINTIEYIRRDSVIFVMLTLGYYVFMGLLGYTQWKRKIWAIEKRNRAKGSDSGSTADKYSMRLRDLEQKEKLVTTPGCSIESNNT